MLESLFSKLAIAAAWLFAIFSLILPVFGYVYIADVYAMAPELKFRELFSLLGGLDPVPIVFLGWATAAFLSFKQITVQAWITAFQWTLGAIGLYCTVVPLSFTEVNNLGPGPWNIPCILAVLAAVTLLGVFPQLRKHSPEHSETTKAREAILL